MILFMFFFKFWSVYGIMNTSGLLQNKFSPKWLHVNFARDPRYSLLNMNTSGLLQSKCSLKVLHVKCARGKTYSLFHEHSKKRIYF